MLRTLLLRLLRFLRFHPRFEKEVRGLPSRPGAVEETTPAPEVTPEDEVARLLSTEELSIEDILTSLRRLPSFKEMLAEYERYLREDLAFMETQNLTPDAAISLFRTNTAKGYEYKTHQTVWSEEVPTAPHVRVWERLSEAYAVLHFVQCTIRPSSSVRILKETWTENGGEYTYLRWNETVKRPHDGSLRSFDAAEQSYWQGSLEMSDHFGSPEVAFVASGLASKLEIFRRDASRFVVYFPDWATEEDILLAYAHLSLRRGVQGCP